jgi:hypothetical protein
MVHAWHEIVVHGSEKVVRAFVTGFLADRGEDPASVLFGQDIDLEPASLGERLRDLLTAGSHVVMVATVPLAERLAELIAHQGSGVGVRIDRTRRVTSASFKFRAEAFSPQVAGDIRGALFTDVPDGVRIEDRSENEEKRPEAKSVDLYEHVHRYVYRASGRIVGEFPGVLEMQRRAREQDFVDVERLHIDGVAISV